MFWRRKSISFNYIVRAISSCTEVGLLEKRPEWIENTPYSFLLINFTLSFSIMSKLLFFMPENIWYCFCIDWLYPWLSSMLSIFLALLRIIYSVKLVIFNIKSFFSSSDITLISFFSNIVEFEVFYHILIISNVISCLNTFILRRSLKDSPDQKLQG